MPLFISPKTMTILETLQLLRFPLQLYLYFKNFELCCFCFVFFNDNITSLDKALLSMIA